MATPGLCKSFHFAQRGREVERGVERRTRRERRVEKSAEEVRDGNKHTLGVGEKEEGEEEGKKVMERCERWGETADQRAGEAVTPDRIGARAGMFQVWFAISLLLRCMFPLFISSSSSSSSGSAGDIVSVSVTGSP